MKRTFWAAWTAVLLLCTVQSTALAGDWLRARSDHFVVTSDCSERRVREYLTSLESLHHVLQLLLGVDATKAQGKPKFELYMLQNERDIGVVRPHFFKKFGGVYLLSREGAVAYVVSPHSDIDKVGDPGLQILFHEYAHHMMFQYASMIYPAWYVEGFAEYLGFSAVYSGRVALGGASPWTVERLRKRPWIDFEDVLKPTFKATGEKDADDRYFHAFYAQSWLLAHYMLSDSERTRKFNEYFKRIGAGEDPLTAFEPAIGIPVTQLTGVLKHYLDIMPVIEVSRAAIPKVDVALEALPAEVDRYLLVASVLKTAPDKEYGQTLLERLRAMATTGPQSDGLDLALARAELFYGKSDVGLTMLQSLATADEGSFEAQYLLGRAFDQRAEALKGDEHDAALAQARAQYFKAYRLKKNDAANLYYLARVLARDGATLNALNAAQAARALVPGVLDYALFEATLDLEAGQPERALRALTPLASNPHDLKFAARMRNAMAAIRAGKSKSEVQAALAGTP